MTADDGRVVPGWARQTVASMRRHGVYLDHRVTAEAVYVWTTTGACYRIGADGTLLEAPERVHDLDR